MRANIAIYSNSELRCCGFGDEHPLNVAYRVAVGVGRRHVLLAGRRRDQVHGSHSARRLLPAQRRRAAHPAQPLRHEASLRRRPLVRRRPAGRRAASPPRSSLGGDRLPGKVAGFGSGRREKLGEKCMPLSIRCEVCGSPSRSVRVAMSRRCRRQAEGYMSGSI